MRLAFEQLDQHLGRGLRGAYLLSGDEPLQLQEAADAIRSAARAAEFGDRRVIHVDSGFDWSVLAAETDSLSLFANRRMIELRMPTAKPGKEGAAALVRFAERSPADVLLLLITGQIPSASLDSAWCRSLERVGALLQVRPLDARRLPAWVERRMRLRGLQPDADAVGLLCERIEGNLLAAAQEIDMLSLLHGEGAITADDVTTTVANSARFDVFALIDSALAGHVKRTVRILGGLRQEGVAAIQILGLVVFELRRLSRMALEVSRGQRLESLFARYRVWGKARQGAIRQCLNRHAGAHWLRLLVRCAAVDKAIKGVGDGEPWDSLEAICVAIAAGPRQ